MKQNINAVKLLPNKISYSNGSVLNLYTTRISRCVKYKYGTPLDEYAACGYQSLYLAHDRLLGRQSSSCRASANMLTLRSPLIIVYAIRRFHL